MISPAHYVLVSLFVIGCIIFNYYIQQENIKLRKTRDVLSIILADIIGSKNNPQELEIAFERAKKTVLNKK